MGERQSSFHPGTTSWGRGSVIFPTCLRTRHRHQHVGVGPGHAALRLVDRHVFELTANWRMLWRWLGGGSGRRGARRHVHVSTGRLGRRCGYELRWTPGWFDGQGLVKDSCLRCLCDLRGFGSLLSGCILMLNGSNGQRTCIWSLVRQVIHYWRRWHETRN
jgi:hypothetical protein